MPTLTGIWDDFVEFVMWVSCSVLDTINASLCWGIGIVSCNEEIDEDSH